jgi:cell division protein ZapA (FtsZ GTPase activity inhibitor)
MMASETKKYSISILGERYSLVSDEPEELVNSSIGLITELIKEISERSSNISDSKIAAFALIKAALKVSMIKSELETYKDKLKSLESLLDQAEV